MRIHFHKWELVEDTGSNRYYQCKKCGKRRVSIGRGYQPINREWLDTGEWTESPPIKPPTKRPTPPPPLPIKPPQKVCNVRFAALGAEVPIITVDNKRLMVVHANYMYYTATDEALSGTPWRTDHLFWEGGLSPAFTPLRSGDKVKMKKRIDELENENAVLRKLLGRP